MSERVKCFWQIFVSFDLWYPVWSREIMKRVRGGRGGGAGGALINRSWLAGSFASRRRYSIYFLFVLVSLLMVPPRSPKRTSCIERKKNMPSLCRAWLQLFKAISAFRSCLRAIVLAGAGGFEGKAHKYAWRSFIRTRVCESQSY